MFGYRPPRWQNKLLKLKLSSILPYYYCSLLIVFILTAKVYCINEVAAAKMCGHNLFPSKIRTDFAQKIDNFQPIRFRANNYGVTKYSVHGFYDRHPIMNIKIRNSARPDTLTGGFLTSFYSYHRSFFVTQNMEAEAKKDNVNDGSGGTVHSIDDKRYDLEMWNVYMRKNSSRHAKDSSAYASGTADHLISINVLFKVGNNSSPRLNPFITAIEKMTLENSFSHHLPYNYDLYALLPRKSSFLIYSSNALPFPYPPYLPTSISPERHPENNFVLNNRLGAVSSGSGRDLLAIDRHRFSPSSLCNPPLTKIYLFETPVPISQEHLKRIKRVETQIRKSSSKKYDQDQMQDQGRRYDGNKNQARLLPNIYKTNIEEFILLRRAVAPASAAILSFKVDSKGDPDSEPFPPDCGFLRSIQPIIRERSFNHGHQHHAKSNKYFLLYSYLLLELGFYYFHSMDGAI